ncbi:putative non-specific serine/threonine protein kinase [Helianthus annuus]|uniref:Non-specific serine/threonine protein kinase n=2 Tax=Helianthus annuus TaxID=4232 RepID=A0A9K3NQV8_HELAN|nr:uncharacterized protein LOC110936609 isoform X2 [Helianthus annuus]XP_022034707.1 uncharacterized protein LOC110936609 isoform X2 [Helianthus annuus]XP_035844815.1 uncharacterized protein LOC110936609 isoform X2 [Helianthus annuus]XP_035844816.1 uncharacterized protein LOC110936609 isoform X2 [Helianthus annuus]KAF5809494.1 putative non-specific serine/threonine protein kinase [Helianthus annuus]KAJ0580486.1 putative non-specific serine/threonine protein kinase [Helianthus annuus]KAJ059644
MVTVDQHSFILRCQRRIGLIPDENDELHRSPGTPVFTAPECCLGLIYHDKAADTWDDILFLGTHYKIRMIRAKGGSVPFEEALATRLDLFKPSPSTQFYLEKRPLRLFFLP